MNIVIHGPSLFFDRYGLDGAPSGILTQSGNASYYLTDYIDYKITFGNAIRIRRLSNSSRDVINWKFKRGDIYDINIGGFSPVTNGYECNTFGTINKCIYYAYGGYSRYPTEYRIDATIIKTEYKIVYIRIPSEGNPTILNFKDQKTADAYTENKVDFKFYSLFN